MARGDTRARLLDAASAVVRRDGAQALTLEAVAAQAGVSKGGLLYHFRSKRELLEAMVGGWLEEFQGEIETAAAAEQRLVRPRLRARLRHERLGGPPSARPSSACWPRWSPSRAVLAAARASYEGWQARLVEESDEPVEVTVARLAADGLWLADLLGLGPPAGELRAQVLARLLELAGD